MRGKLIHAARAPARAVRATVLFLLLLATASTEAAASTDVRTAMTPHREGDLVKTIPISKRPWQRTRSVLSLGPARLGKLDRGAVVEAAADIQTTICIRPSPRHPGKGQACVGRYHSFDPKIRLKLVLAPSRRATSSARTVRVGRARGFECTERPGHRTRHCVHQLPFSSLRIDRSAVRTCAPCHLNLLVSAHHPRAGGGHKIVLGGSDDRKRISQGRSQLSAVVHPRGRRKAQGTWTTRRRVTARPPVVAKARPFKERVVYSQKVKDAKPGDLLVVEARPRVSNNGLPYPTHEHFSIVISRTRKGTHHVGKIAERTGPVAVANGFTCTQRSSGHQSPCGAIKTGIVSVRTTKRFFINLVIGQAARGTAPEYSRWRSSHRTRVLSGGSMRVRRLRGTMDCPTCSVTPGFQSFSPTTRAIAPRFRALVGRLRLHGIDRGAFRCTYHKEKPDLICDWRSGGRFGSSPAYRCAMEAFRVHGRWQVDPCLEAIAARLWDQLMRRGDPPRRIRRCYEMDPPGERARCGWEGARQSETWWCSGYGIFTYADRSWSIDPCHPRY